MVRYVTLRRYLGEIPPSISFRPNSTSAWRYAKQGFLRGVIAPDPALWDTAPPKPSQNNFFLSDRLDDVTFQTEGFSGADSYMGQFSDDDVSANSPESDHQMIIDNPHNVGHSETGNRPSDTWPHTCVILNQKFNGLGGKNADEKLENIVEMMIARSIHGYFLQETWQLVSYSTTIRDHTIFYHGMESRTNAQGRNSAGVMIILGPDLTWLWAIVGKLEPIQSKSNSKYPGRLISVTLSFPNCLNRKLDTFSKRAKGNIKLFLYSTYNPYEHAEQIEFYDELDSFLTNRPRNSELLLGADVNCNVGIRSTMFQDVVVPHG